jgi:hypothetical protein
VGDFNLLRAALGGTTDLRSDFDNNGVVNVGDFNLLKGNYGQIGDPSIHPGP